MYEIELDIARCAALEAGSIQMKHQESPAGIVRKADRSPVTDVDRECEALIRDRLLKHFPNDGFLGEETGNHPGTSGRRWIVDPLDGTRPYIRGIPTFSVLIALESDLEPAVGVIHLPAMQLTCWAAQGGGAWSNNKQVHVSTAASLDTCMGSALGFVEKADRPEGKALFELMKKWDYVYGFMDAYTYTCIACGKLDACVNLLDRPWDCAAAACIITEAGGRYTDITGEKSVHNGSIVLTNGFLHEPTLDFFKYR
jgi:histidinol-phosphatase